MRAWGVVLLFALAAEAAPAERPTLLVLDFQPERGVDAELVKTLHGIFLSHVQELGRLNVMSTQDVRTMLDVQQQKEMLGCADDKCIVDIAGGLGARWVVAGSLGRVGKQAVLNVRLLDTTRGSVHARVSEMAPGDAEEALIVASRRAVQKLFPDEGPFAPTGPEARRPVWKSPWLWLAAGVVVVGAGVGGYVILSDEGLQESGLGMVTVDAP